MRNLPKVVIVTNIPTNYSMPVYEIVSKKLGRDRFHVIFCDKSEDNPEWIVGQNNFSYSFLRKSKLKWNDNYVNINIDVLSVLKRLDAEIIITKGFNPTYLFAFAYAVFFSKLHISMTESTYDYETKFSFVGRIIRSIVYSNSSAFIGATMGAFKLYKSYNVKKERFFQSCHCVNNASFLPEHKEKRSFDMMFSGRFLDITNPFFALNVAAGAAKILGRKVSIMMLGSGPLMEKVVDYASQLSSQIDATFPDILQQSELPKIYRSAKLFLFPSSGDIWDIVVNKACAAGQAAIVSPYAGVANELVCHGINGYVLEINLALWVQNAAELLGNEELLENFSKQSLLKIETYNFESAANGIVSAAFLATSSYDRILFP